MQPCPRARGHQGGISAHRAIVSTNASKTPTTAFLADVIKVAKLPGDAAKLDSITDCTAMVTNDAPRATATTAPTMVIDSDVLLLGLAKAFEVKYSEIQGMLDHGQRHSAAQKSKPDSLRRSVTVAIADAKCEITSLKEIKGASLRAAIKRTRSVRSRSTATSKVGGRPRVGGIETELKHSFPRIKDRKPINVKLGGAANMVALVHEAAHVTLGLSGCHFGFMGDILDLSLVEVFYFVEPQRVNKNGLECAETLDQALIAIDTSINLAPAQDFMAMVNPYLEQATAEGRALHLVVLTNYGNQKTGKSTVMRALFGAEFATGKVRTKRTTEGAFAAIVPRGDFVYLVFDVEGNFSVDKQHELVNAITTNLAIFPDGPSIKQEEGIKKEVASKLAEYHNIFIPLSQEITSRDEFEIQVARILERISNQRSAVAILPIVNKADECDDFSAKQSIAAAMQAKYSSAFARIKPCAVEPFLLPNFYAKSLAEASGQSRAEFFAALDEVEAKIQHWAAKSISAATTGNASDNAPSSPVAIEPHVLHHYAASVAAMINDPHGLAIDLIAAESRIVETMCQKALVDAAAVIELWPYPGAVLDDAADANLREQAKRALLDAPVPLSKLEQAMGEVSTIIIQLKAHYGACPSACQAHDNPCKKNRAHDLDPSLDGETAELTRKLHCCDLYSHLEQDGKESGDVEGVDGQDDAAPASKRSRTSDSSSRRLSDSEFLMGIKEVFQSVATADSKPVLTAALEWVQDAYNDNEEYQIDVATRLTEDQALRAMAVSGPKRKRVLEFFIQ
ncbi:hypothetical protein H9P43_008555 [Blastocladiella emersonii ATCC 22665]|nr:hypothetical protein H9P43_008555 [Blastocladiella emersonii ATCC 22665]